MEQTVEYDGLGRAKNITTGKQTKDIYYAKFGDHATNYVSSVWYGKDSKQEDNTRYKYDKLGNIINIKDNGNETVSYEYDSLNRLIKEDNKKLNKVILIEYDNNGNIISKTINGNKVEYNYSQNGWKDQLISYNGENSEYDRIGNPTIYKGKVAKWENGRNLTEYNGQEFSYNANGIRTSKKVGKTESIYYLDGTNILSEEIRENGVLKDTIYYHYGIDGITSFKHNGTNYIYRKNIQGDITHIYTQEGKLIVKYVYDAFGNHNTYADSGYETLATLNPFRYRGYYYDTTTNLYYLNSRYYDPETGRFINADDISYLDPETINGLNLYSYCRNNFVMGVDTNGNAWYDPRTWDWGQIGKVAGGVLYLVV